MPTKGDPLQLRNAEPASTSFRRLQRALRTHGWLCVSSGTKKSGVPTATDAESFLPSAGEIPTTAGATAARHPYSSLSSSLLGVTRLLRVLRSSWQDLSGVSVRFR
ncbi:unnamed protein product [Ectocarpus sp. 12 AP-2014]